MTMPHVKQNWIPIHLMPIPEVGEIWYWLGFESWTVLYIGECDDVFGQNNREYITLINNGTNQLRTVWLKSFLRKWTKENKRL